MARRAADMKAKFEKLDKNHDGWLDYSELEGLLMKGNPGFKPHEIKQLYDACDQNHDGKIEFSEFVDYIYNVERSGSGRHAMLAQASAVEDDGTETDWSAVRAVFQSFGGNDMDSREFVKLLTDCKIMDRKFTTTDADLIFSSSVPKGKRRLEFNHFQVALRKVAAKKKVSNGEVMEMVASTHGPELHATKAQANRFHDDKSLYTGAHGHNEHHQHSGARPEAHLGRHERLAEENKVAPTEEEDEWSESHRVFYLFAGASGDLDNTEFIKMCDEVDGLYDRKFQRKDVAIVFSAVCPRGVRRMNFEMFQNAVRHIAKKKGVATYIVQATVARSDGPVIRATHADNVRFHDDKSLYTGAHATQESTVETREKERQSKIAASGKIEATEEDDWDELERVFDSYASRDGMDGREFAKLCTDLDLYDKKFTKQDVDIVFTKACPRGERKIGFEYFKDGVRLIAQRKGTAVSEVQSVLRTSTGPVMHATRPDAVKFHDDKHLYTGTHVMGGPK